MTPPFLKLSFLGCIFCCGLSHGCRSSAPMDFGGLVNRPPLPYSILVTGGTFLSGGDALDPSAFRNTFTTAEDSDGEALPLAQVVQVLRDARVFVRSEIDASVPSFREEVADAIGPFDMGRADVREFLFHARESGADYLLVLRGLADGRVIDLGTNDRWPWTFALWLAFGIGAVIPDHSFVTAASLEISLREVQTGRMVPNTTRVFNVGPLDLSLFSRGNSWWWLKMIVVPPFWIGSDEDEVVRKIRQAASQRLLFALASYLKGAPFLDMLTEYEIASTRLRRDGLRLRITVTAKQSLSYVRLRLNHKNLESAEFNQFEAGFLASETMIDGSYIYRGVLPLAVDSGQLQVLLQTIGGEVATSTHELGGM